MAWSVRHAGSPRSVQGLELAQIIVGLRDGVWETTDEVMGPNDKAWVPIEAHPNLEAVAAEFEPPPPAAHPDETRLDMNALIDVCLVLLIFFILTTTYSTLQKVIPIPITTKNQEGNDIRIVKAKMVDDFMIRVNAHPGPSPDKPLVKVENEPEVGLDGLRPVLEKWVSKTNRREMLFNPEGITWGATVTIQDIAKAAGINAIHYRVKGDKSK